MNRRELMAALAACCGAAGLKADVKVVESEPKPLLAVIECQHPLDCEQREAIHAAWNRVRELNPDLPPCVVLDGGLKVTMKTSLDQ